MGMHKKDVPHYTGSLLIDGCTYRITVRITDGSKASEAVPVHDHSEYELLAFCDGCTAMQAGNRVLMLQGGQCCLLRPRILHLRRSSPDTTKYCTLFIQGPKQSPLDVLKEPCLLLRCAPEIIGCFMAMEKELRGGGLGAAANIQALASLILVAVLREVSGHQTSKSQEQQAAFVRYEDIIDDYIALHYAEELRISDLAEQTGVTTRHLARIMRSSYGCTFRQRLLEIRLYYAREYLSATQLPVSQIAIRCGFTAEAAFSAAFRKSIGCTPTEYRRNHQALPVQK